MPLCPECNPLWFPHNRARASSVLVTCDTACGASSKAAQQNGAWVKFSLSRGEKEEKCRSLSVQSTTEGVAQHFGNFVVLGEKGKGKYSISMFTLCLVGTRMGLCSYLCYACLCRAMSMKYKVDSRYGPRFIAAHANVNNEDDDCVDDINSKCTNDLLYIRYLAQLLIGLRKSKAHIQIQMSNNHPKEFQAFIWLLLSLKHVISKTPLLFATASLSRS